MNRLIVPPLPAASRPSKRITSRSPGALDPVLQLQQLDLQQALLAVVLGAGHPLVVRVVLAPGVDRLAVRVEQDRVVVVVVVDPVVAEVVQYVFESIIQAGVVEQRAVGSEPRHSCTWSYPSRAVPACLRRTRRLSEHSRYSGRRRNGACEERVPGNVNGHPDRSRNL